MKTLDQFIVDWTGKGIDYDGAYGFQSDRPIFGLGSFSGFDSISFFTKSSKWDSLVHNFYLSLPLVPFFRKINPRNPRSIINSNISISKIGGVCTYPKIRSSIVKRVVIYVINVFSFFSTHNPSLYLNKIVSRKSFLNKKVISLFADTPLTSKLFYLNKINVIYNDIMSTILFAIYGNFFHINKSTKWKPICQ